MKQCESKKIISCALDHEIRYILLTKLLYIQNAHLSGIFWRNVIFTATFHDKCLKILVKIPLTNAHQSITLSVCLSDLDLIQNMSVLMFIGKSSYCTSYE